MKKLCRFAFLMVLMLALAGAGAEEQPETIRVEPGSMVTFGRYEQDGNPDNGPEKIEWIVLDVREGKCLLLSRYCLDTKPYHSKSKNITWKGCSLRKWLNDEFLKTAFISSEQEIIAVTAVDNGKSQGYGKWKKTKGGKNTRDRIFLLSCEEANRYLGVVFNGPLNPAAQAEPTAYAAGKGAYGETVHKSETPDTAYAWWWLRSPGYVQNTAAGVGGHGTLLDSGAAWEEACVRPALWVNLDELAAVFLTEQPLKEKRTSGDYTYAILGNGTAEIVRYSGKGGAVVLPEALDGYPVSAVGEDAFLNCSDLTSVTVPDGVTAIGEDAFMYCTSLTSVVLPDSLETIGNGAFTGCFGLASVTIPEGVKTIGNDAFYGCEGLTSILIPDSVEEIGNTAFAGCSGLTSVTIPNSVKRLGEFAFNRCKGLTSVTIQDGFAEIPDFTFSDCTGLTSVKIPGSVKRIGIRAFWSCSSLTGIVIPEGVADIGTEAFGDCENLASVTLPDSLASVGDSPFTTCGALDEIRFSANHPYLALEDGVLFSKPDHRLICFTKAFAGGDYIIPEGTLAIGERAFWGCDSMTSVTMPEGMTAIGEEAFCYCNGLRSVRIPASVTAIGDHAFYECPGRMTVTVEKGSFAEQYCKKNRLRREY